MIWYQGGKLRNLKGINDQEYTFTGCGSAMRDLVMGGFHEIHLYYTPRGQGVHGVNVMGKFGVSWLI